MVILAASSNTGRVRSNDWWVEFSNDFKCNSWLGSILAHSP